jgi:hypothetical protein
MTACTGGRPDRVVEPDAIGIISSTETSEDGTTRTLALEDGQEIVVPTTGDITAGGGFPDPDDLLVTGMLDDTRWYRALSEGDPETQLVPDGCYVYSVGPFDDDDSVIFPTGSPDNRFGIRLPKADGFEADDPVRETGEYGTEGSTTFCLNERGEVTGEAHVLRQPSE